MVALRREIKNRHLGCRAFIIGNGPSLTIEHLEMLQDEITFGVNRLGILYDSTSFRPTYFTLVTDGLWIPEYRADYFRAIRECTGAFVDENHQHDVGENIEVRSHVYWLRCRHDGNYKATEAQDNWWSDDPTLWVSRWGTSSVVNLQMATYMGCNPIYLVGFDLGFRPWEDNTDPNHFDGQYGGEFQRTRNYDYDETNKAHTRAHEICLLNTKRLGVSVVNATVGGKLGVYPRENLLEVLDGDS